ncbi:MAG: hypothetical protein ACJASC_000269 [Limimaricola cinnabarinus]|jgi:hypothetical protein
MLSGMLRTGMTGMAHDPAMPTHCIDPGAALRPA